MKTAVAWIGIAAAALAALAASAGAAPDAADIHWAFPANPSPAPAGGWDHVRRIRLYGRSPGYTEAQIRDRSHAVDWRPGSHPPLPAIVADGHPPDVDACGFCHLPAGEGRPENAALAGLSRDYIVSQVRAFASGARRSEAPGWGPSGFMSDLARRTSPQDAAAAADYFSRLKFTSRVRVVEAASTPRPTASNFLLVPAKGQPAEPLGARIVEAPASMARFEHRDSLLTYTAFVPVGSLTRGAALAGGADGTQPCAACHGAGLKGGSIGPPLAGRSPTYLFRQLHAFQAGARSGAEADPMRSVTARMSAPDMIALAAYAGSLKP